jgi:hypothetical protein
MDKMAAEDAFGGNKAKAEAYNDRLGYDARGRPAPVRAAGGYASGLAQAERAAYDPASAPKATAGNPFDNMARMRQNNLDGAAPRFDPGGAVFRQPMKAQAPRPTAAKPVDNALAQSRAAAAAEFERLWPRPTAVNQAQAAAAPKPEPAASGLDGLDARQWGGIQAAKPAPAATQAEPARPRPGSAEDLDAAWAQSNGGKSKGALAEWAAANDKRLADHDAGAAAFAEQQKAWHAKHDPKPAAAPTASVASQAQPAAGLDARQWAAIPAQPPPG